MYSGLMKSAMFFGLGYGFSERSVSYSIQMQK